MTEGNVSRRHDTRVEHWRAIRSYEGMYSVSDRGRVRSENRSFTDTLGRRQRKPGRLVTPQGGWKNVVALWRDGQRQHFSIRRLQADAFGTFYRGKNFEDRRTA